MKMITRPSDRLAKYNSVITIDTIYGKVPMYKFIEAFLFISDKKGNIIPFILNNDQVALYEEMCIQKMAKKPMRINCLKSRRIGISTFVAAIIFCSVAFKAGQNAAIIADIAEHATLLFNIYKFYYNHLPKELQLNTIASSAKEMIFEHDNFRTSTIRIMVQGDSAGRSGTYQYIHMSECAFWDDLDNTLVSLLQTVENSNLDSMVFLETTANGFNEYKGKWDYDCANYGGLSLYKPVFLPWFSDTTCIKPDDEITFDFNHLYDFEKELIEKYNLTINQIAWYREKYGDCNGDISKLRQEFPSNPVEAFITSGDSVFKAEYLAQRKNELFGKPPLRRGLFSYESKSSQDGNAIDISNIKWLDSANGVIRILEEPDPTHPYVVCCDTSSGGSDYYATVVFDNYTCHQVAVMVVNKTDYVFPSYQTYCLVKMYNNALLSAECNDNTGTMLLQLCYKAGHRFIYQDTDFENLSTRFMDKYGYKVKTTNRQAMVEMFANTFSENPNIIQDYETLNEMESFQYVRLNKKELKNKAQATGGSHDDIVMAICGFFYCRNQQQAIPYKEPVKHIQSLAEVEAKIEQRRRENSSKSVRSVYSIWG